MKEKKEDGRKRKGGKKDERENEVNKGKGEKAEQRIGKIKIKSKRWGKRERRDTDRIRRKEEGKRRQRGRRGKRGGKGE